ncbi:putative ATP-grasp-modified RiPP [Streptomyces sp. NPDC047315]|uniref:putative ATP-grasp-modified RiPP n=1 Tax=Streptomyces sp. NPDC047315 TaxID=3155142 RepID=UPI003404AB5F
MQNVPWALRLVTDRLPVSPPPYAHVELDPLTQLARYTDATGQVVEMGKHGTSKTKGTASKSGSVTCSASASALASQSMTGLKAPLLFRGG